MTTETAMAEASERHARRDFLAICSLYSAGICNIAYVLVFSLA
jgi:hypothetical protein